jgi:hypothetical protein
VGEGVRAAVGTRGGKKVEVVEGIESERVMCEDGRNTPCRSTNIRAIFIASECAFYSEV